MLSQGMKRKFYHLRVLVLFALVMSMLIPEVCFAGDAMPWDEPLTKLMKSLTGPAAMVVCTLVIALTGFTLAFGDTSGITKRLIMIVCGIAVVINASAILSQYVFNFSGGLGF